MRPPFCFDAEIAAYMESLGVVQPASGIREIAEDSLPETQRSPRGDALTALGRAEHALALAMEKMAEATIEMERLRAELYAEQTGAIVVAAERRLPLPPIVPSFLRDTERPTQRRVG